MSLELPIMLTAPFKAEELFPIGDYVYPTAFQDRYGRQSRRIVRWLKSHAYLKSIFLVQKVSLSAK